MMSGAGDFPSGTLMITDIKMFRLHVVINVTTLKSPIPVDFLF